MYRLTVKPARRYRANEGDTIVMERDSLDGLMYAVIEIGDTGDFSCDLSADYWPEQYWAQPGSFTLDHDEQPPQRRPITLEMITGAAESVWDGSATVEEVADDRYASNAKKILAEAGGNPEGYAALADWARGLKESGDIEAWPHAIVTADGAIVATARRVCDTDLTAYYIDSSCQTREWGVANREVGLAMAAIGRAIGEPVIRVEAWKLHG